MKRLLAAAACVLFSLFLVVTAVSAQTADDPEAQSFESMVQSGQVNRPKAGVSWREKVMRDRAVMNRASDRRNALKRSAMTGEQGRADGATVESYNAQILKNNAKMVK